jgi:hypothetical protein
VSESVSASHGTILFASRPRPSEHALVASHMLHLWVEGVQGDQSDSQDSHGWCPHGRTKSASRKTRCDVHVYSSSFRRYAAPRHDWQGLGGSSGFALGSGGRLPVPRQIPQTNQCSGCEHFSRRYSCAKNWPLSASRLFASSMCFFMLPRNLTRCSCPRRYRIASR